MTIPDPNAPGERIVVNGTCSAFVEDCYEFTNNDIVREDAVPPIELSDFAELIGEKERFDKGRLSFFDSRVRWPCSILLPAYQMRAFEGKKYPYSPDRQDHPYG